MYIYIYIYIYIIQIKRLPRSYSILYITVETYVKLVNYLMIDAYNRPAYDSTVYSVLYIYNTLLKMMVF